MVYLVIRIWDELKAVLLDLERSGARLSAPIGGHYPFHRGVRRLA